MNEIEKILKEIPQEKQQLIQNLSNKTRLAIIITIMKKGEQTFTQLQKQLKIPTNKLSHHLKKLTQTAIIENYYVKRKNKKEYSYYQTTKTTQKTLNQILEIKKTKTQTITIKQ
ncbi:MAG: winged helix-turn-helix domain-containing protein [Candidatus Ranarchaeia archaeon]